MVETVVTVVIEVGKCLATPIRRQFKYLYNYKSNFDNLNVKVVELKEARDEVKDKVDAAENNSETIKQTVQMWQKEVNSLIPEAETLVNEKSNNRCFKGLCPNLISRYKHSREASKKLGDIGRLLEQEKEFNQVFRPTVKQEMWLTSKDQDYDPFKSRESTLKDILKALDDDNASMIGVYGMGGVGKTTIVKAIGRQVKEEKKFDEVVFVEVTETPDITKIQTELGEKLRLTVNNETEKVSKLYERLEKGTTKTLVILDNLWDDLDLKKIGIPSGVDRGGCKLLLTSRDRQVLVKMGVEQPFLLGNLSEEDAWSLFKKINSGDFLEVGELTSLAREVCMKCGGLPVAIVTVAKALKDRTDPSYWREAIRQFKRPSPANFEGVLKLPYLSIELSYDFLRGEELKKTFLLCSLMGHETSILDLVKYAMGLDIFHDTYNMQEARDKIYSLIQELKDSCLLLDGDTKESFSMHDFIREVAISIARRDDHVFNVRNENGYWEWPGKNTQETCPKIFIRDSEISEIPEILECPGLISFALHNRDIYSVLKIPDNFFLKTTKLKFLDLTRMPVFSLRSSSLDLLKNLQTLCLDGCEFGDVTAIGELKELKILSLRYSYVEQLPSEIGQLTKLRFLDLSNSRRLEVIAPNLISNLVRLEELYISGCPIWWEVEQENAERTNASLEELKKLSDLTTLEICIKDKILPKSLFFKTLERYKISIGDGSSEFGGQCIRSPMRGKMYIWSFNFDEQRNLSTLRTLKLKLNPNFNLGELQSFKNVEFLCLDELQGIKNVLYDLDEEGFSQLKHLRIHNNPNLLCIVDSTRCERHDVIPAFPALDSLILFNLMNLNKIYCGHPTIECFRKLKIIEVESCGKLKNLFSPYNARSLPQIQRISVEDCKNMEEIFTTEGDHNVSGISEVIDKIEFRQLRFLRLRSLPRLTSFYSTRQLTTNLHSNDDELENGLETLTSLFDEQVVFPSLEELFLYELNIEKIWNGGLQNLTRLTIVSCNKLKYVFPLFMVESFKQLKYLVISSCLVLEEIVAKEEGAEANATFKFPKVTSLELWYLPELTAFYPRRHTSEWPMLKDLTVYDCCKLQIFTSDYKINIPNLEELTLAGKNTMTMMMIWQLDKILGNRFCSQRVLVVRGGGAKFSKAKMGSGEDKIQAGTSSFLRNLQRLEVRSSHQWINVAPPSASFQNLTELKVVSCQRMVNLISPSTAKSLMRLTDMTIERCPMMIEIVENKGDAETDEIVFSNLKRLVLSDLQNLTCFYSGNCNLNFPSLEQLTVEECPNMMTFSRGICSTPKLQKVMQHDEKDEECSHDEDEQLQKKEEVQVTQDLNSTIQQMRQKEVNSDLEELTISGKDIVPVWEGHLPRNFDELKVLHVIKDESANIPIQILQRFNNLEKLILKGGSFKEIFSCGEDRKHAGRLSQIKIKRLELWALLDLNYIWKQGSELDSILPNLEFLGVHSCHNLITLVPSSTSFENLTTLEVTCCDGLINLFTSSMAKSLVQLENMKIKRCKQMTEIVSNEEDIEQDEIVFGKLRLLSLEDLNSLTNFSSGNHTFKFPHLEELIVDGCREMETFRGGVFSTPRLHKVKIIWALGSMITLLPSSTTFENLATLEVHGCDGLRSLVTFSVAKSLMQLEEMKIEDCDGMTEVVANEGNAEEDEIVLHKLKSLSLSYLSNLTCFCSGNYTFKFPALEELFVSACFKMKTFYRGTLSTPSLQRVKDRWLQKEWWEGDLNTTIQKLHKEENEELKRMEGMEGLWLPLS